MSNIRGLMADKPYLCIVRPFIQVVIGARLVLGFKIYTSSIVIMDWWRHLGDT